MSNSQNLSLHRTLSLDEGDHELLFGLPQASLDDTSVQDKASQQLRYMMDTLTRLGGDVIQLKSEVDTLLEQNMILIESFKKLKAVLSEKSLFNFDDFELACDVLSAYGEGHYDSPLKKFVV